MKKLFNKLELYTFKATLIVALLSFNASLCRYLGLSVLKFEWSLLAIGEDITLSFIVLYALWCTARIIDMKVYR